MKPTRMKYWSKSLHIYCFAKFKLKRKFNSVGVNLAAKRFLTYYSDSLFGSLEKVVHLRDGLRVL